VFVLLHDKTLVGG